MGKGGLDRGDLGFIKGIKYFNLFFLFLKIKYDFKKYVLNNFYKKIYLLLYIYD